MIAEIIKINLFIPLRTSDIGGATVKTHPFESFV
jgi:hypothetical protein